MTTWRSSIAVAPFLHIVEMLTLDGDDRTQTRAFAEAHHLSRRETEFVELTIRGLQNGEIAMLTGVSSNTVRNTLAKVFEKVHVSNRAELAYLATRSVRPDKNGVGLSPEESRMAMSTFGKRVEAASRANATKLITPASPPTSSATRHIAYTPPIDFQAEAGRRGAPAPAE
jgi:DNA-binding CsgD family transcriptional regulator